jgi:hypothetical protein
VDVVVLEVVVHVEDVVVLEVVVHVEDVVVLESEQVRTGTLPKNLVARLSRAGSLGRRGSEATAHASSVHTKLALGMAENSKRSPKQEYLGVRMCVYARGGSPLT